MLASTTILLGFFITCFKAYGATAYLVQRDMINIPSLKRQINDTQLQSSDRTDGWPSNFSMADVLSDLPAWVKDVVDGKSEDVYSPSMNQTRPLRDPPHDPWTFSDTKADLELTLMHYQQPYSPAQLVRSAAPNMVITTIDEVIQRRIRHMDENVRVWRRTDSGLTLRLNFDYEYPLYKVIVIIASFSAWATNWTENPIPSCDIQIFDTVYERSHALVGSGYFGASFGDVEDVKDVHVSNRTIPTS